MTDGTVTYSIASYSNQSQCFVETCSSINYSSELFRLGMLTVTMPVLYSVPINSTSTEMHCAQSVQRPYSHVPTQTTYDKHVVRKC